MAKRSKGIAAYTFGWGAAEEKARKITEDSRAGVKFFPRAPKGGRYGVGFNMRDRANSFIPLAVGASWEDALNKLAELKKLLKEKEAADVKVAASSAQVSP